MSDYEYYRCQCGRYHPAGVRCAVGLKRELAPATGLAAASVRKNRIRAFALELLDAAGYIPKPRLKAALRIACRCENQKPPNAKLSDDAH